MMKIEGSILSLCDFTGNWSGPYAEAGYDVIQLDLKFGQDVRLLRWPGLVHGILAAPPCAHFSRAGAHLWKHKGDAALLEGLSIVDSCLRLVAVCRPTWWALENPIGRLQDYLGPASWKFDPWQFGDAYTKRTWLWGCFTPPVRLFSRQARCIVEPSFSAPGGVGQHTGDLPSFKHCDRTTYLGSRRKVERSTTPPGFARAFCRGESLIVVMPRGYWCLKSSLAPRRSRLH